MGNKMQEGRERGFGKEKNTTDFDLCVFISI